MWRARGTGTQGPRALPTRVIRKRQTLSGWGSPQLSSVAVCRSSPAFYPEADPRRSVGRLLGGNNTELPVVASKEARLEAIPEAEGKKAKTRGVGELEELGELEWPGALAVVDAGHHSRLLLVGSPLLPNSLATKYPTNQTPQQTEPSEQTVAWMPHLIHIRRGDTEEAPPISPPVEISNKPCPWVAAQST
ncbi:uncharacterized protein BP5553_09070 [Venustampulla echinocandica]|uniref:Uncharacterized protein n=1 Tax=Venustampulla echinocandica TaxID=2656787 RepID=A0A370TDT4_9HELO|nr:uncharacterized protein BP5553_09070 [Venustampulla echinocandica]RDL32614.1 hypothetical protein BP5553_09070 [Venustampulla echinocandica]